MLFMYVQKCSSCLQFVSDIAVFVLKRDVKLQLTNSCLQQCKNYFKNEKSFSRVMTTNVLPRFL